MADIIDLKKKSRKRAPLQSDAPPPALHEMNLSGFEFFVGALASYVGENISGVLLVRGKGTDFMMYNAPEADTETERERACAHRPHAERGHHHP